MICVYLITHVAKNTGTMANDRRQWYPGFNNEEFPANQESHAFPGPVPSRCVSR